MASAARGATALARPRDVVDVRGAGVAMTRVDDVVRTDVRVVGAVGRTVEGVSALANIVCACMTLGERGGRARRVAEE